MLERDELRLASNSEAQAPLLQAFDELGLNRYQSRVLVALLQAGSDTPSRLASLADVPRTSVYPVLKELHAKDLAAPMPGKSMIWAAPGREEVIARLRASQEDRLQTIQVRLKARMEQASQTLGEMLPAGPAVALPYVRQIHGRSHVRSLYDRLLSEAKVEILVCNQAPYGGPVDVNPIVLETLARGVTARALYQAPELADPLSERFLRATHTYIEHGVRARVVQALPLRLALFDRRAALLAMLDPMHPEGAYPTHLFVEHPGFAEFATGSFEKLWEAGEPYEPDLNPSVPAAPPRRPHS